MAKYCASAENVKFCYERDNEKKVTVLILAIILFISSSSAIMLVLTVLHDAENSNIYSGGAHTQHSDR